MLQRKEKQEKGIRREMGVRQAVQLNKVVRVAFLEKARF